MTVHATPHDASQHASQHATQHATQHASPAEAVPWRVEAAVAARRLALLVLLGAVTGLVTVGVLSRFAMALLASLNPEVHGVRTDDGFPMGQVTLSGSLNLALAGLFLGVVGGLFHALLAWLAVGPRWFRLVSLSVGAGVVVGAMLVHTEGVDFTRLEPLWLAVALFVALPVVFVGCLHVLAEWLLPRAGSLPWPLAALGLLGSLVLPPLVLLVAAGWCAGRALRRQERGRLLLEHPAPGWVLRAGLAVVFVAALVDLGRDVTTLS